MRTILTLILSTTFLLNCKTPSPVATASKNANGNLIGVANKASFNQDPYQFWFQKNYKNYIPDTTVLSKMKPYLKGIKIKGFMGTWCGDSKRETPKFYKILEQTGIKDKNIELIAVNRSKKTPNNLQKGYNIIRVPTFIFYKNGTEIGRFVEYPIENIEKDFLKIVSGQDYKHAYQN